MGDDATASALDDPLARRLFARALLRGSFTLRSGVTSDRYFDKYRVTCEPTLLGAVAIRLADLLETHAPQITRIIAPELGAVPLATALALETATPFAIVRSSSKGYGTANRIEGVVRSGEPALLLEDVITSGGAALDALQVARDAGLHVTHGLCVLDRDGGGREALEAAGVTLVSVLDSTALDAAYEAGIGLDAEQ